MHLPGSRQTFGETAGMSSRRCALLLSGLVAVGLGVPDAGATTGPAARTADSLMPSPFRVEHRVEVDLDKDGDRDVAMVGVDGAVPAPAERGDDDGDGNRVLVVARRDRDGFRVVGIGRDALLCRTCGGAFWGVIPTPVELSAARNVLVVVQEAGARELTGWTHRYRIERGRVRLIGLDRAVTDRLGPSTVSRSTNLLTGVTITTVDGTPEEPVKPGTVKGSPRTVWLEDVELS